MSHLFVRFSLFPIQTSDTLICYFYMYSGLPSSLFLREPSKQCLIIPAILKPRLPTTTLTNHHIHEPPHLRPTRNNLTYNKMGMGKRTTVHHCPKASKGNCRKGTGTDGMPICTKHQKNCTNVTRVGKVCSYPRLIDERCRGPCSR